MSFRTAVIGAVYKTLIKPLAFRFDPEDTHDQFTRVGVILSRYAPTRFSTRLMFGYRHPMLRQTIKGITFENPVGLSAGFDKDGLLVDIIPDVGFGFEEVGSVTGERCEGNPRPRLWRVPEQQSIRVWYGLKNDGCEAIAARLAGRHHRIPLGVSVAKTNCAATVPIKAGIADYVKAFRTMEPVADYITINISCPNAFGGQPFTTPQRLELLLRATDKIPTGKPVFIKLSPDISMTGIDALVAVAKKHNVQGFVCTNLTKKGQDKGGLSGKAVEEASRQLLARVYRQTRGSHVLISVGGIFTAEDAYDRIKHGASLVQLITGMIYEGPQAVCAINQGLVRLLKRDGHKNIKDAVGVAFRQTPPSSGS